MAIWKEICKQGDQVEFADGTPFVVGQQVKMGLGFIELRDTKKAGLHVVRLSKKGRFKYSLKLTRDGRYRLGPNRGHRVVEASEEADPIKRVLREVDIPVSKLVRATEPTLEIGKRWYDNHHCPVGRNTNQWFHDGCATEVSSEVWEEPHGHFGGGGYNTFAIEGASYAVCVSYGRHTNGAGWRRVSRVVVWPHCGHTALAGALASILYGDGADAEYLEALKDYSAARNWIARRYEYRPEEAQEKNVFLFFRRRVGYRSFSVVRMDDGFSCVDTPVNHLFRKFGIAVVEGLYEAEMAEFQHLLEDCEAAAAYVVDRFNLRRTPTGISWYKTVSVRNHEMKFQVAEKGLDKQEWVGPSYNSRSRPYPKTVEVLLKKHGDELKRRLFDQALPSRGRMGKIE